MYPLGTYGRLRLLLFRPVNTFDILYQREFAEACRPDKPRNFSWRCYDNNFRYKQLLPIDYLASHDTFDLIQPANYDIRC